VHQLGVIDPATLALVDDARLERKARSSHSIAAAASRYLIEA
jgi:hypothetical protein